MFAFSRIMWIGILTLVIFFSCNDLSRKTYEYYSDGNIKREMIQKDDINIKEVNEYYKNGVLKSNYSFYGNLQHGLLKEFDSIGRTRLTAYYDMGKQQKWLESFDSLGRRKVRRYFYNDSSIYDEVYTYRADQLKAVHRSFSPIVALSKDTINAQNAIGIYASLPLPDSFFESNQYTLKFDFVPMQYNDPSAIYYAEYSLPLGPTVQEKKFIVEDTGNYILYGYVIEGNIDTMPFTTSHFRRQFYVRPNSFE